jgi:hypothetical protein
MLNTRAKPLLVFLGYESDDFFEANELLTSLRSAGLWVDNFCDGERIPPNYQQVVEIQLDNSFSLDIFLCKSRNIINPMDDAIFSQWMENARDVLGSIPDYSAPRVFYLNGIPMNSMDKYMASDLLCPDVTVAGIDIDRSIEVMGEFFADGLLEDYPSEQISPPVGDPGAGKELLSREFPGICESLRKRVGEERFAIWLGALNFEDFDAECIRVSVPNAFLRDAITTDLADEVLLCCQEVYPSVRRVEVVLRGAKQNANDLADKDN